MKKDPFPRAAPAPTAPALHGGDLGLRPRSAFGLGPGDVLLSSPPLLFLSPSPFSPWGRIFDRNGQKNTLRTQTNALV